MKVPDRMDYVMFGGIFVLANKLQFVADKMVDGLSTKQWFLIRTIMDLPKEPPPTIMQIVREMDSTRQNVTKMLEKLERDGLVILIDNDTDRRSRRVIITESGYQYSEKTTANAQEFLNCLFKEVSPDDIDTAGRVVLRMLNNLSDMETGD